jgi:ankyrin repeat protein
MERLRTILGLDSGAGLSDITVEMIRDYLHGSIFGRLDLDQYSNLDFLLCIFTSRLNERTSDGLSLLHVAVRRRLYDTVHLLLRYGANPNLKSEDSGSETPWQYLSGQMHGSPSFDELRSVFNFRCLVIETADHLWTARIYQQHYWTTKLSDLLETWDTTYFDSSASWVHVPSNSVSGHHTGSRSSH